jgi:hypothetical protein
MREQPHGADLLQAAIDVLRGEIMPALQPEHRHAALMVASALAIAARQSSAGSAPEQQECATLAALLASDADLAGLNALLGRRIRAGAADPGKPQHAEIIAQLRQMTRERVLESCPKILAPARPV